MAAKPPLLLVSPPLVDPISVIPSRHGRLKEWRLDKRGGWREFENKVKRIDSGTDELNEIAVGPDTIQALRTLKREGRAFNGLVDTWLSLTLTQV